MRRLAWRRLVDEPGVAGRVERHGTPFARMSPSGKFRIEVVGLTTAVRVIETKPAAVWPTTVRLPVIASAPAGTPQWPADNKRSRVAGRERPGRPDNNTRRVSISRPGVSG